MEQDDKKIIEQFIDYLQPELTPYETAVYLYLLRKSYFLDGSFEVRIGKRTIADKFGKGARGKKSTFQHISKVLKSLEEKSCVTIKDINVKGTLIIVSLPEKIPLVVEKIANLFPRIEENDYFNDQNKRLEIFERDKWICQYCGEKVDFENASLDHCIPQTQGGRHNKENLKTCCFLCNSIKSGKSYEKAAPLILENIKERKAKSKK